MAFGAPRIAASRLDQATASTSWAVPYETGVTLGELLLIFIGGAASTVSPTATGWTLIGTGADGGTSGGSAHVLGKIATSADVTASAAVGAVTVTMPNTQGTAVMVVQPGADAAFLAISGAQGSTTFATGGTATTSFVLPTATTAANGARIFYFESSATPNTVTATGPAGSTELFDWGGLGLTRPGALYQDTADQAVAGATGSRTVTISTAKKGGGVLFAIRPSAAAPDASQSKFLPFFMAA